MTRSDASRRAVLRSHRVRTAPSSASCRPRRTAWSPRRRPTSTSTWSTRCSTRPRSSSGRPARRSPTIRASPPSACGAERPGLVVTALSPFGLDGPWRDRADHRLHPAGALRRSRAARHSRPPAVAVRRAPGGVGRRHLRRDRRLGRAATGPAPPRRRPGRRRRPRRADVQPAAVPGDLVPGRRGAVPAGALVATPEPPPDRRRVRRAADDHRSAVARLLHHDRPRRLVRRRAAGAGHVPHAAPARARGGDRGVDHGPDDGRDRRAGHVAPRTGGRGGQRRDPAALPASRRRRVDRREPGRLRATGRALPPRG